MEYLLTLDEFTNINYKNNKYKELIDDTCEFPKGQDRFSLRLRAIQRINDIVMFHRFVMATYENNRKVIDPRFSEFNDHYNGMFNDVSNDDLEQVALTRMTFQPFDIYKQQSEIKSIASESIIINLWATIEQYTNRVFKILSPNKSPNSLRWHEVIDNFNKHNINVESLSAYDTINELRVLNNKIKHSYLVEGSLADFDFFKDYKGEYINNVPLRIHDYSISAYHFIIQLINIIGPSEKYTDDEDNVESEENNL